MENAAAKGGFRAPAGGAKKRNCLKLVTGVTHFFIFADILSYCPFVNTAVTAPSTPGSGGHLVDSTATGPKISPRVFKVDIRVVEVDADGVNC